MSTLNEGSNMYTDIVNPRRKRTSLSQSQQRRIKRLEGSTGKKLTLLWEFTNPLGEKYIFGRFGLKKDANNLVATISHFNTSINRFVVAN